jgi:16S rRNA (guanine966-N2)-methyltransferase
VRVSAGALKGRRLAVPGDSRPTSERARSGLFDWIGPRIEDAEVLDLFAGSGALGIEALSRGARSAVFVERARSAASQLRRNLDDLELGDRSQVQVRDVARALASLARAGQRFAFVFADPPYQRGWLERLAKHPELLDILAPAGGLIFERSKRETPVVPARLELAGTKLYGETAFDWFVRQTGEGE